ncbi:MAG: PLP-dependent aminotransferase family protein [Actinomycetota bacterium]|nr:PLP-dependent aminotransferase family protein [Actinomycetota bacterium]
MNVNGPRMSARQIAELVGGWRPQERRTQPGYSALAAKLRTLIVDGRIPAHSYLPPERQLATALGASRTTVASAYGLLRDGGFAESRQGSGTRVRLPDRWRRSAESMWLDSPDQGVLDLTVAALPAPAVLADAAAAAASELAPYGAGHGYDPLGLSVLREAVALRYTERGLRTTPDQILVTAGAQHALWLVARAFVRYGQRVVVESPAYPNTIDALRTAGARLLPLAVTSEGWDVQALDDALKGAGASTVHVSPDFQNPTGALMSPEQRLVVAAAVSRSRARLVVDETFSELSFDGSVVEPFAALDEEGTIISLGSMSKAYWGGVRVGWIRAASPVIRRLGAERRLVDLSSPVLDQLLAARLLDSSQEVLRERQRTLRTRCARVRAALATTLPTWEASAPSGGMSMWVRTDLTSSTDLAIIAARHGVRIAPGSRFGLGGTLDRFIRLPFTLRSRDLQEAVHRLGRVRQQAAAAPTMSHGPDWLA